MMTVYEMLDNGPIGSPGETTRVITSGFLNLKTPFNSSKSIIRKMMNDRGDLYRALGMDILSHSLVEDAVEESKREVPFAVFVDMVVTNKAQNNLDEVLDNFDVSIEVILDNYNRIMPTRKGIYDYTEFKTRAKNFMNTKLI